MTENNESQTEPQTETSSTTPHDDGIDRRGFLKCMLWAGTGVLWTVQGGVLHAARLETPRDAATAANGDLHFVQISDSHVGFNKPANTDVVGTLRETVAKINTLQDRPSFVLHTGDISHLAKPDEFDTVAEVLKGVKGAPTFYVPGEHDIPATTGNPYLDRYGKGTQGDGWYSFDQKGVHFIALVNVVNLKDGLGQLGAAQIEWLRKDVSGLSASTPIVVFAHIPLWAVYPDWGWGTADSEQALSLLRRFGSVTVLNGHIHQALQKIEGNITFHSAMSTAFPHPPPGKAAGPGPMVVPAERLRSLLGLRSVSYVEHQSPLAIIEHPLAGEGAGK